MVPPSARLASRDQVSCPATARAACQACCQRSTAVNCCPRNRKPSKMSLTFAHYVGNARGGRVVVLFRTYVLWLRHPAALFTLRGLFMSPRKIGSEPELVGPTVPDALPFCRCHRPLPRLPIKCRRVRKCKASLPALVFPSDNDAKH